MSVTPNALTFDCPRCHQPAEERFYGPCSSCREQLNAAETVYIPDLRFRTANAQDGRQYTAYDGPVEWHATDVPAPASDAPEIGTGSPAGAGTTNDTRRV